MSRSMPTSTQLLFDVKVEPSAEPPGSTDPPIMGTLDPKLKNKPLTRYGLLFALPVGQIAFKPGAGGTLEIPLLVGNKSASFAAATGDQANKSTQPATTP